VIGWSRALHEIACNQAVNRLARACLACIYLCSPELVDGHWQLRLDGVLPRARRHVPRHCCRAVLGGNFNGTPSKRPNYPPPPLPRTCTHTAAFLSRGCTGRRSSKHSQRLTTRVQWAWLGVGGNWVTYGTGAHHPRSQPRAGLALRQAGAAQHCQGHRGGGCKTRFQSRVRCSRLHHPHCRARHPGVRRHS
jgi:hypothetical protein